MWCQFVGLRLEDLKPGSERQGRLLGGGFEFLLLPGGKSGNGGTGVLVLLEDEFRLKRLVPAQPLLRQGLLKRADTLADFFLFPVEATPDHLDLGGAVGLDHGGNGVPEKQQDERVGDGDAHQYGDYESKGELRHFPENGKVGAITGE